MASPPAVIDVLYTNDGWNKRRKVLFRLIGWEVVMTTMIVVVSLFTRRENTIPMINTLITVVVPALLAAISAQAYTYVFGVNQDDKDKREKLPTPTAAKLEQMSTAEQLAAAPPEGFAAQQES